MKGASQQPGTGRGAPAHAPPAHIIALKPSNTPGRRANKQDRHKTKIYKMPKATLNHLKIFPLNRIIVPIKNQSKLFRIIGYSASSLGDFPIKQIFHVGFSWLKAPSCKSLLISIVLTQVSSPNGWRVLVYSFHLHLLNSADLSLICVTRGDQAKGPTLREQSLQGKNYSHT